MRRDLSCNRCYYIQNLKYDGGDLFLTTNWFKSEGVKDGIDKKAEMLFLSEGAVRDALKLLDEKALEQLKLPSEFIGCAYFSNATAYRRVPETTFMYAKLDQNVGVFSKTCQPLKLEDLSYGEYRIILHVKGIYIGPHGQGSKLASLQMRIHQIQFSPLTIQCMFTSSLLVGNHAVVLPSSNQSVPPATPQPGQTAPPFPTPNAPKKPGRRPTKLQLQRQQTVQAEKPASVTCDFFDNLDLDACQ